MSKPNLVFILSDQHRGDWMGCAGSRFVHTPHLDRMAREGVHFTRAYCNSPLCVPSRMSMLTGQSPHRIGVFSNGDTLPSDTPTFAHALGLAGYETVLCGRMHFVGPDQRHGFQHRLVGDITHCYPGGPKTDYGPLQGASGQGLKSVATAGPGHSPVLDYDEQVVSACEAYMSGRASDPGRSGKPLFITVGFYGPHHPYVCPPAYYEQARSAMADADAPQPRDSRPLHPWYDAWFDRLKARQITDEQLKVARASYAGLISLTDTYVGRVLEAAKLLPGDTWVVYASDHGDMAGDRGMFWKRNMLEGALRVPLLFFPLAGEGRKKGAGGKRIAAPVSLLDLAPTFAGLAGAPPLPEQEGCDLTPLLLGTDQPERDKWKQRPVLAELANAQDGVIRAVIRDEDKLIYYDGYEDHLMFHLGQSPTEQVNAWAAPGSDALRDELLELIMEDGWNPRAIKAKLLARAANQNYMERWGKQVGMGPLDLWNQAASGKEG